MLTAATDMNAGAISGNRNYYVGRTSKTKTKKNNLQMTHITNLNRTQVSREILDIMNCEAKVASL